MQSTNLNGVLRVMKQFRAVKVLNTTFSVKLQLGVARGT